MGSDDVIEMEDLARVRAQVAGWRRTVLVRSALVSVLAGLTVGLLFYYLKARSIAASAFMGTAFLMLGLYNFFRWWRHFRSVSMRLDDLERRVRAGETVFAAQVALVSHR